MRGMESPMAFNPEDMTYVTLSNGVRMPQLGYGVYQVGQGECMKHHRVARTYSQCPTSSWWTVVYCASWWTVV